MCACTCVWLCVEFLVWSARDLERVTQGTGERLSWLDLSSGTGWSTENVASSVSTKAPLHGGHCSLEQGVFSRARKNEQSKIPQPANNREHKTKTSATRQPLCKMTTQRASIFSNGKRRRPVSLLNALISVQNKNGACECAKNHYSWC